MARRECLDCGHLHSGTGARCPDCTRQHDQQRGTTTQRGLGWDHQRAREQVLADATVCAECGLPPTDANPLTAGHVISRLRGGSNDLSNYQPECAHCNYSKGAQAGHTG